MSSIRVMVCPMNDATLRVPLILPPEGHLIPWMKAGYSWRDIDVVSNKDSLSRVKFQDKKLMPAPVVVVAKNSLDCAAAFDLEVADALLERATQGLVTFGYISICCSL